MSVPIALELLAPAKNLECGIAAIDHGADAVYIGPPRFGARAAAGNSLDDIAHLCQHAHQFRAKVYATVNTIVTPNERPAALQLLEELGNTGIDAILIQDLSLISQLPAIPSFSFPLHASTQTDNRTADKVKWLRSLGFRRVVLARELSVSEIAAIHQAVPDVELEVFVHGALCVSYSGICYASQHCFQRSANRGECAQFCRMPFDLVDADGHELHHQRHLLSLKDLNMLDRLEKLVEAGATSFKIEGRLKDVDYVKNVTAAYSQRLDRIIASHPGHYRRASIGHSTYSFTPNLDKTFHREYTDYFAAGRQPNLATFITPKATGEYVGTVQRQATTREASLFTLHSLLPISNGDGLCYVNASQQLEGFRVNRAERIAPSLWRIHPHGTVTIPSPGTKVYRNSNQQFTQQLSRPTAQRKIPVSLTLTAVDEGFRLSAKVAVPALSGEVSTTAAVTLAFPHQTATTLQRDNIVHQLTRLGATPYECTAIHLPDDFPYFIPSSQLSTLRRKLTDELQKKINEEMEAERRESTHTKAGMTNIASPVHPVPNSIDAPEGTPLMQCRYCLRHELGYCTKNGGRRPDWCEPLYLRLSDGRCFRLEFDCRLCQMNVIADP